MKVHAVLALTLSLAALFGCKGGGSATPECRYDAPASLAQSAWPKFRHDLQNTGRSEGVDLSANLGQQQWVFPGPGEPPKGAFAASPVMNDKGDRIYIGSVDGTLYALDPGSGAQLPESDFTFSTASPITSTALAAVRSGDDAIFVGAGNGDLFALGKTGLAQPSYWPFPFGSFVSASPTLNGIDGTVYLGSLNGLFYAVCPNGIARFGLSLTAEQSSPAVGVGGTIYFGADDRELRAIEANGTYRWAFATSAPILNAPLVEAANNATVAIYVADSGGRVFKVSTSGQPIAGFAFGSVGSISSSPALAGDHLYVGSDDGSLYAIDTTTGQIVWTFSTGGPVVSSPAVAVNADGQRTVVVGSDDGSLYFIADNGPSAALRTSFAVGAPLRSSPAIGGDGTVYVGADDGHVYAIK